MNPHSRYWTTCCEFPSMVSSDRDYPVLPGNAEFDLIYSAVAKEQTLYPSAFVAILRSFNDSMALLHLGFPNPCDKTL